MKKVIAPMMIVAVLALCAFSSPYAANSYPAYQDTAKPKVQQPQPEQPYVLVGSKEAFEALRNALISLKFYSKSGAPDVKEVELLNWISTASQLPVDTVKKK